METIKAGVSERKIMIESKYEVEKCSQARIRIVNVSGNSDQQKKPIWVYLATREVRAKHYLIIPMIDVFLIIICIVFSIICCGIGFGSFTQL
jgi:hypothetical protein